MLKIFIALIIALLILGCINKPSQKANRSQLNNKSEKEISDGYSSQSADSYTGSASQIKDLGSNITLDNYLRRVAGVYVKGDGASAQITIRGINTFSPVSSTEPLFVLNNTVMGGTFADIYNMINPNDISSVSVLKDASSTGIYGSRAANGVIVIQLKKK